MHQISITKKWLELFQRENRRFLSKSAVLWLRGPDLNRRPSGYEALEKCLIRLNQSHTSQKSGIFGICDN